MFVGSQLPHLSSLPRYEGLDLEVEIQDKNAIMCGYVKFFSNVGS